ncbi:MAG: hypothetical protein CVU73_15850 [Deltaproteobacteria bacterium HGW-Deltaproteobacteria-8]|jgi:hypothetical protein|nr:MAG: hypothetical protein CVU73_15850 [Deltaproteobacteria bacterium HGW-Deltaproteobacteria-8]
MTKKPELVCPRCKGKDIMGHLTNSRRKGVFGLIQSGCRSCGQMGPKLEVPNDCPVMDPYFIKAHEAWEALCTMEASHA